MSLIAAIIGRPNVGKSTLFNRLTMSRHSIVEDVSGVTRDRQYGTVEWNGQTFTIVDTGGFMPNPGDIFEKNIHDQVLKVLEEADVLLFMVDNKVGITSEDEGFANVLRKTNKTVLVVANKSDNFQRALESHVFHKFGFDAVYSVSSVHGTGTGELLDHITEIQKEKLAGITASEEDDELKLPKLVVLGRPNVGKSTFINSLLGEERSIVTDIPGTTRDSVHTKYEKFGKSFLLIDTAGLRKKAQVKENIEFYSVMRTIRALEQADVCMLMIDANQDFESQDQNLMTLAIKRGKGVVLLANKWDLAEKETNSVKEIKEKIYGKAAPFKDFPIIFISATGKQRIFKALETALEVFENKYRKIPTSKLNDVMLKAIQDFSPPAHRGKFIKIKYVTQVKATTPSFAFFCSHPELVKEPYRRYLENKLRSNFNLHGVPVRLFFREK